MGDSVYVIVTLDLSAIAALLVIITFNVLFSDQIDSL